MPDKNEFPEDFQLKSPRIHPDSFVASGAQIVGDVDVSEDASIWFNAVLRGDINAIRIGERTNIQDGAIIHVENDQSCIVGNDVTVGHGAILHGCTIEDGCLIGMGATVLNGAVVQKGAVIGANALVKEHAVVEEGTLWVGMPAKKIKDLGSSSFESNKKWAAKYVELSKQHKKHLGK